MWAGALGAHRLVQRPAPCGGLLYCSWHLAAATLALKSASGSANATYHTPSQHFDASLFAAIQAGAKNAANRARWFAARTEHEGASVYYGGFAALLFQHASPATTRGCTRVAIFREPFARLVSAASYCMHGMNHGRSARAEDRTRHASTAAAAPASAQLSSSIAGRTNATT
jgi:hypothetical protein